mgnify:CR=1 FL=1
MGKKKVLVVGGGGREHAIVDALSRSPQVGTIYCAPGNAGIATMAECVRIKDTDVEALLNFAKEKQTSCIMCHEQPSIEKLQRTGVVELDANNKVLGMEEKPQVPKSHWAVPPFYIYLKKDLDLVRHSVENGCGKDAPGNLAHYMVEHTTMHAWPMSGGRFDIGSLDTYYEAVEKYGK